jgi:hypothetical protein
MTTETETESQDIDIIDINFEKELEIHFSKIYYEEDIVMKLGLIGNLNRFIFIRIDLFENESVEFINIIFEKLKDLIDKTNIICCTNYHNEYKGKNDVNINSKYLEFRDLKHDTIYNLLVSQNLMISNYRDLLLEKSFDEEIHIPYYTP